MTEEWRDVAGYNGSYQVSNLGNVHSLVGRKPKPLRLVKTPQGHFVVKLYMHGFGSTYRVHVLVWLAFVGSRPAYIYHADGDLSNNAVTNLVKERKVSYA